MAGEELLLYRGIAVPPGIAGQLSNKLRHSGIQGDEGRSWSRGSVRDSLEDLFEKPDLTVRDTRPSAGEFRVVAACGDSLGATWYAFREARSRTPFVITLRIPLLEAFVDSRDFLVTCFQFWDKGGTDFLENQTRALSRLFGKEIVRYFRRATGSISQQYRIAMCDLACEDQRVARSHSRNEVVIRGRYSTTFCSAFFVKAPIPANRVVTVETPEPRNFEPQITLEEFLSGRLDNFG